MKKNRLFLIAALATATFTLSSCINDEYDPSIVRLAVNGLGSDGLTRAAETDNLQNTQFMSGVGIRVEAYETGATTSYSQATYTTTNTVGSVAGSITLSDGGNPIYYPANKNVDICAFYPSTVVSTPTPTATFTVNADQTTTNVANYRSSDLMYATKASNLAKGSTHGLTFNHALSQVLVNLIPGDGLVIGDLTSNVTSVKINGTQPTANLTFAVDGSSIPTGVVTAAATGATSDIEIKGGVNTAGTQTSNIGIIVPQTVAASTTLFTITYITTAPSTTTQYTWDTAAAITFEPGKQYVFNFTLNLGGLVLESIAITDWLAGTGSPFADNVSL